MSRIFHVWWLVIVAIIIIALIVIWALYSGSQSLSANSLYDAVNSSATYAREKGSRMDRGTFVINRNLFQQRLSEYKIKGYGRVGHEDTENGQNQQYGKPTKLYIHYLRDDSSTDGSASIQGENVSASEYGGTASDLPIRAIQVTANSANHHNNGSNKVGDTKDKYVATDVVQEAHTDNTPYVQKKINEDLQNTSRRASDYKSDSTHNNDQPIQHPNENKSNHDDPTDNSFNYTYGINQGVSSDD